MKTAFSIKVDLTNGEARTFKDEAVISFEMQDKGLFFVHSDITQTPTMVGKTMTKMHYRYVRTWIPFQMIKDIEIITNKEIDDAKEIEKYQKFLEHGIDMMMTPISKTVPKTVEQVQDEIDGKKEKEAEIKPATPDPETKVTSPQDPAPAKT